MENLSSGGICFTIDHLVAEKEKLKFIDQDTEKEVLISICWTRLWPKMMAKTEVGS